MKKILTIAFCLLGFMSVKAQDTNTDLSIRYNETEARFEVYARPTSSNTFNLGPSQISVVFPASVADVPITVSDNNLTSINGGTWSDNSRIFAPGAQPESDFHGFGSSGAPVAFVAGEELLMFHFTLAEGCVEGLRIFDSSIDPPSSAQDMAGSDFENSMADAAFIDHYNTVYSNTGTTCPIDCNVQAPQLSLN